MTVAGGLTESSSARPSSVRAARRPNIRPSIRTVDRAGRHAAPTPLSSKPITARSFGAVSAEIGEGGEHAKRHLVVEGGDRRRVGVFAAQRGDSIPSILGRVRNSDRCHVIESEPSAGLVGEPPAQGYQTVEVDLGRNGERDRAVTALGKVTELGQGVRGEPVDPSAVVGVGRRRVDLREVDHGVGTQIADEVGVAGFARRAGIDEQSVAVGLQFRAHALDEAFEAASAAQSSDRQQDDPAPPFAQGPGKAVRLVAEGRGRGADALLRRAGDGLARRLVQHEAHRRRRNAARARHILQRRASLRHPDSPFSQVSRLSSTYSI